MTPVPESVLLPRVPVRKSAVGWSVLIAVVAILAPRQGCVSMLVRVSRQVSGRIWKWRSLAVLMDQPLPRLLPEFRRSTGHGSSWLSGLMSPAEGQLISVQMVPKPVSELMSSPSCFPQSHDLSVGGGDHKMMDAQDRNSNASEARSESDKVSFKVHVT